MAAAAGLRIAPWALLLAALLAGAATLAEAATTTTLDDLKAFVAKYNMSGVLDDTSLEELMDLDPQQLLPDEAEDSDVETFKGTYKLLQYYNYTFVNYTVRTEDGYLLGLFRLPQPGRPAVLLMHGLLSSSADWVVIGPGRALAFQLFDAGYDVWLGNARGNSESRRHVTLQPSQAAFWNFSWHEIGKYDLPALIDYVLEASGQPSLYYIGHSQGCTTFLVLGCERPDYMRKVKAFLGLAPVAFPRDMRSIPLRFAAIGANRLDLILQLLGVYELVPRSPLYPWLGRLFCGSDRVTQPICSNLYFLIFGYSTQLIEDLVPRILVNLPAGASTKQVQHYGQNIDQIGFVFRQFDYGVLGNLRQYKALAPPDYNLTRVSALTYLFHSESDSVAVKSDLDQIVARLPNLAAGGVRTVPLRNFNHGDFLLGAQAKELLFDPIEAILREREAAAGN